MAATVTAGLSHSFDGPKWTVAQLVKKPAWVPSLVTKLVEDSNIAEWLLRDGPTAAGGAVAFEEVVALYADTEGEVVAEYGEYPGASVPQRTPVTRATTKRGVHLRFSEEMVSRNDTGRAKDEMESVRRTLVHGRDKIFFNAVLNNPGVLSIVASNDAGPGWVGANTTVRADIAEAEYQIASQGAQGVQYSEKLGYQADTLIIHPMIATSFIDNDEVNRIFAGSPLASQQLRYTGLMPRKFMNLDVMMSWRCPTTTAIVCQRKYMGFISKEWPLRGTPLKYNEDNDSYRSNFRYRDLVAIDNPKAVCFITNIDDGAA